MKQSKEVKRKEVKEVKEEQKKEEKEKEVNTSAQKLTIKETLQKELSDKPSKITPTESYTPLELNKSSTSQIKKDVSSLKKKSTNYKFKEYDIHSSEIIDDELFDEYYKKPLFKKSTDISTLDIKNTTIDEALQLLQLPTIHNSNQITLSKENILQENYSDEEFNNLVNDLISTFHISEKDIINSCLDYYKGLLPQKKMIQLLSSCSSIDKVIKLLYSMSKVLEDKKYISRIKTNETMLNTKQYSVKDALQLLGLPSINKQYDVLLSESDIIHGPTKQMISSSRTKLTKDEKEILDKCIDYYNNVYPTNKLIHDLSTFHHNLSNVIQFLYKFQNIYLKRSKKEDFNRSSVQLINKPMNLEKALQLVKLPSFKDNKMITLSKKQIYKTSLRPHELELIEFCEDYYKGFYPEIFMKEKLQNSNLNSAN